MDDREFQKLAISSCEYLTGRRDALAREFRIGSYKHYQWCQGTGELIFSDAGVPIVVARIQFVGSVSRRAGTWMWSWANPSIESAVKDRILEVKRFGESREAWQLVEPTFPACEADGWELTSISANLLQARGAYRTLDHGVFTYLILTDVRWYLSAIR